MASSVLLVDDDPMQNAIMNAYFSSLGTPKIQHVTKPEAAIELLKDGADSFDLVISDIRMPQMDGLEFMRHLNDCGYKGQFVIVSGIDQSLLHHAQRLAKIYTLNIIGELAKPVKKDALDRLFVGQSDNQNKIPIAEQISVCEEDLKCAMANDEITSHYQPKIRTQEKLVVGAEALARWNKPDVGNISPEVFITLAEKSGLIKELTFYLLDKVLDDLCGLKKQGHSTKIAVNISSELVGDITLPEQIVERLNSKELTVKDISIEVTEDRVLNLDASTLEVISRLRVLGFDVAIDDFGTGSSNIQTIRDFPFSELKIDRSFISDITTNMFSRETVNAAVFLAREQNMKIVAEGIEDKNTWDLIRKLGIEYAQGYFLANLWISIVFMTLCRSTKMGFLSNRQSVEEISVCFSSSKILLPNPYIANSIAYLFWRINHEGFFTIFCHRSVMVE